MSAHGVAEIQERLKVVGYAISKIDGKAGMNTRALIGAYQRASRLKVDCWPSVEVLGRLRSAAASQPGQDGRKSSLGAK
jgi:peptidoglycan hydrolase-like protein with peptidoglycan-binding domain